MDDIRHQIEENIRLKSILLEHPPFLENFQQGIQLCVSAFRQGRKLMFAGNGGSAADCQHIVGEFVYRLHRDRPALNAMALTADTSIMTAISNDLSYTEIFSRQLEAYGKKGDVFLPLSTSGKSSNILRAVETARRLGVSVFAFTKEGSPLHALSDASVAPPSHNTQRLQETHLLFGHILCSEVERILFFS